MKMWWFPQPSRTRSPRAHLSLCVVCSVYRHNAIRVQPITGSCTPPLNSASYTRSNCVLTCTPQGPEPAPPPARARSLQRWGTQEWQWNAIWMSGRSPTAQHRPAPPARGGLTRHAHNHAVVDAQHKALHARVGAEFGGWTTPPSAPTLGSLNIAGWQVRCHRACSR